MDKPDTKDIPVSPGVYLYKDAQSRIIYVGKAKNLRKRVLSYFRPEQTLSAKTRAMLAHAVSLETLTTATEKEAFLLEASLIKKHRPRYNIVLRDDKEYILFRLKTAEVYPRLEIVRRARPGKGGKGVLLFGPYSSAGSARETWQAIHHTFPLRRCPDRSFANRVRPCLYYHMGRCLGPCVMDVQPTAYAAMVGQVAQLLSGRSRDLIASLKEEMLEASESLDFERAAMLRDRIAAVERTLESQVVVLDTAHDLDVLGIAALDEGLGLCVLFVRQGVLLDKRVFFWPGLLLDDAPELLESFLLQFYRRGFPVPPRIVTPWLDKNVERLAREDLTNAAEPDAGALLPDFSQSPADLPAEPDAEGGAPADLAPVPRDAITVFEALLAEERGGPVRLGGPRSESEDRLVSLATDNAREGIRAKDREPLAQSLARALHAPRALDRIEAVDVSHTGGRATRVGMVVFQGGQPLKNAYRAYAVEAGGDDYAALGQWAERRIASGPPWPDLLLIDGGKGQLAAVFRVFREAGLEETVTLAAIAKARDDEGRPDRRSAAVEDRIFLPGRSNPLPLPAGSPELFFLQQVRDSVHDFALGRHRRARSGQAFAGELLRIPGIGPKTARLLWERFGSLAAMAEATREDLAAMPGIGKEKARLLHERLRRLAR